MDLLRPPTAVVRLASMIMCRNAIKCHLCRTMNRSTNERAIESFRSPKITIAPLRLSTMADSGSFWTRPLLTGGSNRSTVRSIIFLALIVAALTSQLSLLSHHDCSSRSRSFQVPIQPTAITHTRPLPSTHRLAQPHECIASRSTDYAPASFHARVSLNDQQQFALGGYNKIARGSGDVNACGPIISVLSRLQHAQGIYGTLAEFGVHHGRFTGFLFTTARVTEKLLVGDLFAQQDKNVDRSGLGDKRMFLRGLLTYGLDPRAIHAVVEASTDELPFDFSRKALAEPFRIVSVDASHT